MTAFVVFQKPGDEHAVERLRDWVRAESGMSPYKRPKAIVAVDEIPKSPVGKILRRKLTEPDPPHER